MPRSLLRRALVALSFVILPASGSSANEVVLLAESAPDGSLVVFQVDLTAAAAAAKIEHLRPESIVAVDASNRIFPSQFIPAADFDPRTHAAGALLCRLGDDFDGRLRLRFDRPASTASSTFDGTVHTKEFEIVHRADAAGGFPSSVTFSKSGKKLTGLLWLDRLYEKAHGQLFAAKSPENSVERVCDGPLAVVVRVKAAYTQSDKRPESTPSAVYDWVYFRDSPLVWVTAAVRQDTPYEWDELHFLELHSKGGELPEWIGGEPNASGKLAGENTSHEFADWAAFSDGKDAIGFVKAGNALLYDGKGFGPYLIPRRRLNWSPWSETTARRSAWMWIGTSDNPAAALSEADAGTPRILPAVATTANLCDRIAALAKSPELEDRRRAGVASLLQSLGRIEEATAAAGGDFPSGWHLLDAGELSVALEKTADGIVLRGILDSKTNRRLTAAKQPPLLELEFCTPLTEENAKDYAPEKLLIGSDTGWKEIDVRPTDAGLTVNLSNPADARLAGVRATLVAKADTKENGVAWSLSVENKAKDWALTRVRFPQVALREFSDDMQLLVPHCCGEIERDPCGRTYRFDNLYPNGWCTMEFEAVYSPAKRTGLYWAMHDPRGSTKRIRAIGDPATSSVTLGFEHPVPDMRKRGVGYELPGTAQWRILRGDWFDAACIYRNWVRKEALWYPKLSDDGRTDTPGWMKELSVWALMPGDAKTVVPAVKKFQEYLGVPVGVHWYQWHQIPFDNDYPHYFPVKEGFAEGVAELQKSNVYVMPYINGRLWDTHDREAEDFEFTKIARPGATKDEKGAPLTETYRSLEKDGSKVALAAMCPTTEIWQDKVAEIIDRLFNEYGVNGVYVDQVAAATPKLCFDASHGHPLGGGSWWNEGYWKMFDRIRAEMPKDRMLTTECNADPFTKWFDGFLSWHWQSNEQVPAFSAVYGGAIQMFGRAYKGGETKDLALRMKSGQQLCFGEQIGWISPGVVNEQENAPFFRRIVRLRYAFRRYFYAGEMARPPKIGDDVPTVTADWQWHKEWVTTPAVLTGAWRLPKEGKTVLFLVNVSDKPVKTTVTFDGGEYGFDRFPISATIHAEEGKAFTLEADKPSFEVTFPPRSAQAWELRRADSDQ